MSLEIRNMSRRFGGVHAAQGVSMTVEPGTIVGLIGPNGAGKSTIVNLITGMLRLDAGNVLVDGVDVSRKTLIEVARVGVSRTFQNIRLLRDASVLENVALGLAGQAKSSLLACMLGMPSALREQRALADRAMDFLEQVGMAEYARHTAGALAYGHQRRVEIARAIAVNPKYILLDEPVAGMNDVEAGELGDLLKKLAATGIGILLIEHNMGFVHSLCSHVYVLSTGALLAQGTPGEVSRNPEVVAAYLGA